MDDRCVNDIPDSELIRRVLLNLRPRRNKPLWSKAGEAFALGSTYSWQLCLRYGLNPDATNHRDIAKATEAADG